MGTETLKYLDQREIDLAILKIKPLETTISTPVPQGTFIFRANLGRRQIRHKNKKLRKFAKQGLDAIPIDAAVVLFVPGKSQSIVPIVIEIGPKQEHNSSEFSAAIEIQALQH